MNYLSIACGVALLLGIPYGLPYVYYVLLRWFIFISSVYLVSRFYKAKVVGWAYAFGAILFIFNPFFPIYLDKSTWVLIDFVSALVFFVSINNFNKDGKI